jgi:hypothetical protein
MHDDSGHECGTDPAMQLPPEPPRQARQMSAGEQGLEQEQRERNHARETGRDVDRIAPGKERTCCRDHDRHAEDD